ncbi:MAG: S1C family serine protease [Bdellovibrionales bacterium]
MKKQMISYMLSGLGLLAGILLLSGAHVEWPNLSHANPVYVEKSTAAPLATPAVKDVKAFSDAFTLLSEQTSPTVVNIYTKSGFKSPRNRPDLPPELEEQLRNFGFDGIPMQIPQMKVEALGSGFVINADEGYIITNAHVVRQAGHVADEIMVKFIGEDNGKGHAAKVIGADEISDVALLKLVEKKSGLKAAVLGDSSKAKVGEWVLAIGNPYGHTHTVTQGIISAIGRNLDGGRSEFLQTSASINPGNSGGPLINMNGEVIGINSIIDPRAQNIGFAIPINMAKEVVTQLVDGGHVHRAWLGIGIEDLNDEAAGLMHLKETDGVLVKEVIASTPAAKAGIEKYDVIRKIDGKDVHNTRELFKSLAQLSAGKTADVEILRGGSSKTLKVKLGEQPANS